MSKENVWEMTLKRLDDTMTVLNLKPGIIKYLKEPRKIVEISVPVKMDNGDIDIFKGYRVQHNTNRGPAKGGIRYHQDVTLDEMKALAMYDMECRLLEYRSAGQGAGCVIRPCSLRSENLTRRYIYELIPLIGPEKIYLHLMLHKCKGDGMDVDTYSMAKLCTGSCNRQP